MTFRKFTVLIGLLVSFTKANATIYTHTLAAGDYTGAQISGFLTTACSSGDCTGSGTDTVHLLIPDGVWVSTNGDWGLTSFTTVWIELQGETSQIDFDNNNETIDMSETSFLTIDQGNDGEAGDDDTEPGLESANSGNNLFNIGDNNFKGSVFDLITQNGGVSYAGYGNVLLPIELLSFEGTADDNDVYLNWSTASELNNDRFEILHSLDADSFKVIQEVNGSGTTLSKKSYDCIVSALNNGTHYFKLRQVDYDGRSEDFEIIAVEVSCIADLTLFPNPTADYLNINFGSVLDEIKIEVHNAQQDLMILASETNTSFSTLDLSNLPKGVYSVRISAGTSSISQRVIRN
jgi:hypothetical protein